MGYNLYITRKDEWFDEHGPEIEPEEWLASVEADPSLEMRGEAIADLGGGQQLVAVDETMAVWMDDSGSVRMWFYMFEGDVIGKNPNPDAIAKMHEISVRLNARLMGEDCEIYDAEGRVINPENPPALPLGANKAGWKTRPWWKFW